MAISEYVYIFNEAMPRPGARYELPSADTLRHFGHEPDTHVFRITHEGAVLATGEHNYYDDSDFYALVWDDATACPREVGYATTRGWTYGNSASVDATPERVAKWEAWKREQREAERREREEELARTPDRGKRVRVVKGRKVPKGTEGEVFWYGLDKYRSNRWATWYRVGLLLEDGSKVFVAAENVEVIRQLASA